MGYKSDIEWTDATWNPVTVAPKYHVDVTIATPNDWQNDFVAHPDIHMNTGLI